MIAFLGTRLILFTCLSFLLSSTIFITSFLEFGDLSFWLNVFSTGIAIIYHVAIGILSWQASLSVVGNPKLLKLKSGYPPAYTIGSIAVLSAILVALVGALVVKIEVAIVTLHPSTPQTTKDPHAPLLVMFPIMLAMELAIISFSLSYTLKERTRIKNERVGETQMDGSSEKTSLSSSETAYSKLNETKGFFTPPRIPSVATTVERNTPWGAPSSAV
ncbi:hypothetical protein H0H92_014663 [Tricholoma furcatifolium]|nr:hypothetical protein H0H92_014663 [Tricholoma furcatifolium]